MHWCVWNSANVPRTFPAGHDPSCLSANAPRTFPGHLPTQLGDLSHLKALRLGGNKFSGKQNAPRAFPARHDPPCLRASTPGMLTGQLPTQLGKLVNLETLDLSKQGCDWLGDRIEGSTAGFSGAFEIFYAQTRPAVSVRPGPRARDSVYSKNIPAFPISRMFAAHSFACSPNMPRTFAARSPHIPRTSPACLPHILRTFSANSSHVHRAIATHSQHIPSTFPAYSRRIPSTLPAAFH